MQNCYYTHSENADVRSLTGQWQFRPGEYAPEEEMKETVLLPGTTDTNRKGSFNADRDIQTDDEKEIKELTQKLCRRYVFTGKAVYAKTVDIPSGWSDKNILLLLERTKETKVWINGIYAGWGNALGTAQAFDITGMIVPGGENTIAIEVDNSNYSAGCWFSAGESGDWITNSHMATEETTTNWNGIIGKIQLIAENSVYIRNMTVHPQAAEKKVRVRLAIGGSVPADGTVTLRASGWNGTKPHTAGEVVVEFHCSGQEAFLEVEYFLGGGAELWSEFSPVLYRLRADLSADGGRLKSSRTVSFGLREFRIDNAGKHFEINGITTFLRGEANCNVFPVTGCCIMDKEDWTVFLQKLKDYGVNFLRFHSWCPPEAAFEAADELGMYMQPELYLFGFTGRDPFATYNTYAYMKEEGERLLTAYANHPSFVMLSFGNETAPKDMRKMDLYQYFKALAPDKLIMEGTCTFFWDNGEGDRNTGDYRAAMTTSLGECREQFYFEKHAPATNFDFNKSLSDTNKPFISHEIGQYQMYPDYDEIAKYEGTVFRPVNFEYFRGFAEKKGMLEPYKLFHKASSRWAALLYREEVEAALRTFQFAGYELLSFQDFPGQQTALVGFYDSFMDSKNIVSPEEFRRWNSEIVLLAGMSGYIWSADEPFTAEITVANYSTGPLTGVTLFWTVQEESGDAIASGKWEGMDIPQGGLTKLGQIHASLEAVTCPEKLKLEIGIENTTLRNSYYIWVYPAETAVSVPEGIFIARVYDEKAKEALAEGGKVLLLPETGNMNPEKSVSGKFMTDFWSKAFHDYGKCDSYSLGMLIDPEHPALSGFPTDFHSNWQWYDLVKNSRSVILDGTEASFRLIVQTIDHPDRSCKLGNLFEAGVGGGRLLVCMFDLPALLQTRPEARQLYKSLLAYMNSDLFNPSQVLTDEIVQALFGPQGEIQHA